MPREQRTVLLLFSKEFDCSFISKSDPICFMMKSLLLVLCYYLYSYF